MVLHFNKKNQKTSIKLFLFQNIILFMIKNKTI